MQLRNTVPIKTTGVYTLHGSGITLSDTPISTVLKRDCICTYEDRQQEWLGGYYYSYINIVAHCVNLSQHCMALDRSENMASQPKYTLLYLPEAPEIQIKGVPL